jgi:hypothetical protein
VNEDIDAAVLRCGVVYDGRALLFGGDVEREEVRQYLALLRGAVGPYDAGPFRGEGVDDCIADSAAGPGYQNDLVFEAHLAMPFAGWLMRCSPGVGLWMARFIFRGPYFGCLF